PTATYPLSLHDALPFLLKPFPGWIDGFKVADPLIMAYARGVLPEFPVLADSILDVIPVDYVVNVIVALATQEVSRRGDDAYFQVDRKSTRLNSSHVKSS